MSHCDARYRFEEISPRVKVAKVEGRSLQIWEQEWQVAGVQECFVCRTIPKGELASRLRKSLRKMEQALDFKVKIVERTGEQVFISKTVGWFEVWSIGLYVQWGVIII